MAPLVIKYWACHGRCRGLFQMLAETSTPYEHVTDMGAFGAAHFGAATANLAPPIVVDGALVLTLRNAHVAPTEVRVFDALHWPLVPHWHTLRLRVNGTAAPLAFAPELNAFLHVR